MLVRLYRHTGWNRGGIGGALIFDAKLGNPPNPVSFMSPEWRSRARSRRTPYGGNAGHQSCVSTGFSAGGAHRLGNPLPAVGHWGHVKRLPSTRPGLRTRALAACAAVSVF